MFIFKEIITIESGKRGGKPCIRGLRINVEDVLRNLSSGMSIEQIIGDFPELSRQDILTCLEFAAEQQKRVMFAA